MQKFCKGEGGGAGRSRNIQKEGVVASSVRESTGGECLKN